MYMYMNIYIQDYSTKARTGFISLQYSSHAKVVNSVRTSAAQCHCVLVTSASWHKPLRSHNYDQDLQELKTLATYN